MRGWNERYRSRAWNEQRFREQVASEAYQQRKQARVGVVAAQVGCEPAEIKEVWDQLTGGYPQLSLEAPDGTPFRLDGDYSRWTDMAGYVLKPDEEDPYAEFNQALRDWLNSPPGTSFPTLRAAKDGDDTREDDQES